MIENDVLAMLFDRRSTHNELLKRSADIIKFAVTSGLLTTPVLELVWDASQYIGGEETQGIVFSVRRPF